MSTEPAPAIAVLYQHFQHRRSCNRTNAIARAVTSHTDTRSHTHTHTRSHTLARIRDTTVVRSVTGAVLLCSLVTALSGSAKGRLSYAGSPSPEALETQAAHRGSLWRSRRPSTFTRISFSASTQATRRRSHPLVHTVLQICCTSSLDHSSHTRVVLKSLGAFAIPYSWRDVAPRLSCSCSCAGASGLHGLKERPQWRAARRPA